MKRPWTAAIAMLVVGYIAFFAAHPPKHWTPECGAAYARLFANSKLRVVVAFGYKDTRPERFVGDRYERNYFVARVTAPCTGRNQACGFKRSRDDAELFSKSIDGPDFRPREIELRVIDSSAGPDDEENRRDSFQNWKSAHTERVFLEGLARADVVFYDGHSRDGGGPDFDPPRLAHGHADYAWYKRNRPGLMAATDALSATETPAPIVGMFSCASSLLFSRRLTGAGKRPKRGIALFTSPKLLYFTDALEGMLGALSALLAQECHAELERTLHSSSADLFFEGFY